MSDGALPEGWRTTFEGSRILEYSYRSDNIEVSVTPDATPARSRTRTAADTAYRVQLQRTDAGLGDDWALDAWGDGDNGFDLVRTESLEAARERAVEFMERFNRNREAVETEALDGVAEETFADAADAEAVAEEAEAAAAVFDHEAAVAAVIRDTAAAVRAAGEMEDDGAGTGFATPHEDRGPAEPTRDDSVPEPSFGSGNDGTDGSGDDTGTASDPPVGSVSEVVRAELGDAVRAVVHYERGSYETAYYDEATDASPETLRRVHGELQFLDLGLVERELPGTGGLSFAVLAFDGVWLLRFVREGSAETLVAVDDGAAVTLPALSDRIERAVGERDA